LHLKIVPDTNPDAEGFWVEKVYQLEETPLFSDHSLPGHHIVAVQKVDPGPVNQPGFMYQATQQLEGEKA
jgi:hypothetical protein